MAGASAKPPAWGCKLGDMQQPGFSPHMSPGLGSMPAVNIWPGSTSGPLIDGDLNIYLNATGALLKLDADGLFAWKLEAEQERYGVFATSGALLGGCLLVQTSKGFALSINTTKAEEVWCKQYCKGGSIVDMGAVAVEKDLMICCGKDAQDEALKFNTSFWALDPRTGRVKWSVRMKFGCICFVPSIVGDAVIVQGIQGDVCCYKATSGAEKWVTKPAGQVSTATAVACAKTGMVYSAGNARGKKEWNKPNGGKGLVRAFDLATGALKWDRSYEEWSMEANTPPAVVPLGEGGKQLVIVGLGANPGTWDTPTGNYFPAALVALDALDGTQVWALGPFPWLHQGPGGTEPSFRFKQTQCMCWSSPVASANGLLYIAWHGCILFEIDCKVGEIKNIWDSNPPVQANVAIGPGMLVVCSMQNTTVLREGPKRGTILRELTMPFSESGYDHFWPTKQKVGGWTGHCSLPATTDISNITMECADVALHWARLPGMDFYHKTPVVDSQRNVYLATNHSHLLVIRPDGHIRGHVELGVGLCNPCLHGQYLYICSMVGFCFKVDIETLEVAWAKKYTAYSTSDSWNPVVSEKTGIILVVGMTKEYVPPQVGGARYIYGLNISDGSTAWQRELRWISYNFLPSYWDDEDLFVCADNTGGMYGHRISTGERLWEHTAESEDNLGAFTTGHCASCPNGLVYNAWNRKAPPDQPCGIWNKGMGTGGVVRAYERSTGEIRWSSYFPCECHVAPVAAPVIGSGGEVEGYMVCVPQGSQGGYAADYDDELEDDSGFWPSGDAWESWVVGLDGETGEEKWRFTLPIWKNYGARGSMLTDIFLPDCFGSPTCSGNGKVYVIHWSGTGYCLDSATGQLLSEVDTKSSSQSAVVILPGTTLLPCALSLLACRDEKLEAEWLEKARADGDPRADPRLWEQPGGPYEATEADCDAITRSLRVRPDPVKYRGQGYRPIPPPFPKFCEKTYNEKNDRQIAKYKAQIAEQATPAAPAAGGAGAAAGPGTASAAAKPTAVAGAAAAGAGAGTGAGEVTTKQEEDDNGPLWQVVGGGKAGGIVVRKDQGLKSAELGRLSTGARVREQELIGERLHYQKIEGDGPDFGWVSLKMKGADLLKKL